MREDYDKEKFRLLGVKVWFICDMFKPFELSFATIKVPKKNKAIFYFVENLLQYFLIAVSIGYIFRAL